MISVISYNIHSYITIAMYNYEGLTFNGTDRWNDRWQNFSPDLILNN